MKFNIKVKVFGGKSYFFNDFGKAKELIQKRCGTMLTFDENEMSNIETYLDGNLTSCYQIPKIVEVISVGENAELWETKPHGGKKLLDINKYRKV